MAAALYLSKLNVNGQEYQIKDANAAQDLTDLAADLASKVGYAIYDERAKAIIFYDNVEAGSRTELFKIDATDFIKDGMVSNVEISEGNLVITFNTDAGQEPISIALTDIFNPANYYNKTEVDGKLDLKADASNVYTKSEADGKFLTEHQSLADYPTIETMNTALGQKANVSDIYTQTEIDNKLAAKADASNVYTKSEIDTQSETTAQALSNINTQLAAKANSADLATVATSGSYNDLSDKPVIPEGAVVDAALSDTSENPVQNKVVKGAIDEAKAYYVDFAAMSVQGITDADWDGLVAAINAHRPILVKVSASNGYVNATSSLISDNVIYITGADGNYASTYTFTKNGSNDYSVSTSTKEFVSQSEKTAWNAKQDAISDLATIRSGAEAGATAYQKPSTGIPASDIADGVIPTVPTNVSAFTNDAGYLTEHQSLADYYTKTQVDTALASKANSADLATVATSGSYNDLADKPTLTTVSVSNETLFITTPEFE